MNEFAKTIEDVALRLPSLPIIPRKNFFDILSVQRKETVNSKILAYFFDANEDHAFGELFKNALLSTLKSKKVEIDQVFYTPLTIATTEERTTSAKEEENQFKWIDIVLEGDKWCIIIENKVDHLLNNPLNIYLEHAKTKNKNLLCVVLSLHQLNEKPGDGFINITHQDFINEVRKEIPFDTSIPEIDLFYLREYFKNIESHYFNLNNQPMMNDVVTALASNSKAILEIETKKREAINFINAEIERVFSEFNYYASQVWHVHPENENLCFRITDAQEILETNSVSIFFEVWKELKDKTTEEEIEKEITFDKLSNRLYHERTTDKTNSYKLAVYHEPDFINPKIIFRNKLIQILKDNFFCANGIEEQAITKLRLGIESAKRYEHKS
jgi:hypothetical protein